jgi:RimJ/RimL family protein N-acetyltransferase
MNVDIDRISFRRLAKTDLRMVHDWLNSPEVAKWYKEGGLGYPSLEYVTKKWSPRILGSEPTQCYIVLYEGKPIGYMQCALNDDNPRYKEAYGLEGKTAGIDIFIGDEHYLHKGMGSSIITKFLQDVVLVIYDVSTCTIDPEPVNSVAIRAYEKAGFRYLTTVWNPIDNVWAYLMSIHREAINPFH